MVKKTLFATMFAAVLSAGALSARQLGTAPVQLPACGSPCSKTVGCNKPCLCFVVGNNTTGFCQPEGPPPPPDMRK
jgi:hypothetical protein